MVKDYNSNPEFRKFILMPKTDRKETEQLRKRDIQLEKEK